ncbi:MAG: hypothetical protein AAF228_11420 [Pseudomonadota bacterium]
MTDNVLARLNKLDGRFELTYPDYGIRIRAPYAEWVFEAAADIIRRIEKTKTDGDIDELQLMQEIGEGGDEMSVQIDAIKYNKNNRFEVVPQCVVSLGDMDYRWVSRNTQAEEQTSFGDRIHNMAMTRSNSFLVNEEK